MKDSQRPTPLTIYEILAAQAEEARMTDQGSKYEPLSEAELAVVEHSARDVLINTMDPDLYNRAHAVVRLIATIRDLQGQVKEARSIAQTLVNSEMIDRYCKWCAHYEHEMQPGCNVLAAQRFLEATAPDKED